MDTERGREREREGGKGSRQLHVLSDQVTDGMFVGSLV